MSISSLLMRMSISLTKNQFLPDLKDVKNKELKKLSKRLEEDSKQETLTNIVEWQERNILYWVDRADMFIVFCFLLIFSICFLPIPLCRKTILSFTFILFSIYDLFLSITYLLPVIGFLIAFFTLIYSVNFSLGSMIQPLANLIALSMIFGGFVSLLTYMILKYRNIKSFQPEFKLSDTFKLSLSVDKILKYRLAICRDYAKLTSSLLFNMYPDSELYFITIRGHVATGIKIKNKIYVLDQRLPILSMDNWLIKWNKEANIYKLKIDEKSKRKPLDVVFDRHEKIPKKTNEPHPKIDTEKLTEELAKILGIKQNSHKDEPDFEIPLPNYAIYYEDDEITKYSLIRVVKNRLKNELCGNMDKISKINISQNKRDLILSVCL